MATKRHGGWGYSHAIAKTAPCAPYAFLQGQSNEQSSRSTGQRQQEKNRPLSFANRGMAARAGYWHRVYARKQHGTASTAESPSRLVGTTTAGHFPCGSAGFPASRRFRSRPVREAAWLLCAVQPNP